jgi:hypothetical protein
MPPGKPTLISDREIDAARLDLLRKRLMTFGHVVGGLILLLVAVNALGIQLIGRPIKAPEKVAMAVSIAAGLMVMIAPHRRRRAARSTLRRLIHRTQLMVVASVLSQMFGSKILAEVVTKSLRPMGFTGNVGPAMPLYLFFGIVHFAATLVMPWTWKEALVPVAGMAFMTTMLSLGAGNDSWDMRIFGLILALIGGLPGVLVSIWRTPRMRELLTLRLIGDRYEEVEHELSMARRIHERLFPKPIQAGPIRVSYAYEPMRQIGGDYLDLVTAADGSVTLALIDVTGHGVAAALAVHRLHGELKRVMAQTPTPGPASIARALNEYVLLTLADERVFATAALIRIEPSGLANLCIAGHPSPLIAKHNGAVEAIDSTAMMLGVFPTADFIAEETLVQLNPGDALIIYTDGATEALDAAGRQLGTEGLRKALSAAAAKSAPDRPLETSLMNAVAAHRVGAAQDDTLVVCATRV